MRSSKINIEAVDKSYIGERVDKVLSEILEIPRNQIQKYIKDKMITVNDCKINKSYRLKVNDKIKIIIPPPKELKVIPKDAPIKIVYEDDHIVVVDKPAGLVVHPGAACENKSVISALIFRGIKLSNIGAPIRPGVVHRIDKDTSGIIVLAKDDKSHFKLAEQFFLHSIERRYIGITECHLRKTEGIIDRPIARHRTNRKTFTVSDKGKEAVTLYKVIKRLEKFDVVMFKLKTGRTHQIRVHMKSMGCSLLGDVVYGKKSKLINRQALHAYMLGIKHPESGEFMNFYSKLPKDMKKIVVGG